MLTVRELFRDVEIRLLAGEEALDAPVRWVHITELEDPTPWLSGGEMLLTTGLQLGSAERQRAFVRRLADHGLAGLGFGVGFGHEQVPEPLIAAARERGLPLFEIPYAVPFIAITETAFSRLVNEQYAILRRAIAAHERLERIVLSERGIDAVAGALATLVGGAVLVFDARGALLASRSLRAEVDDETVAALEQELRARTRSADAGGRRGFAPSAAAFGGRALALPVGAGGDAAEGAPLLQAWLVAAKDAGALSEFDRLTLHQAVTIVALELLRRRVAEDTERRLAGDVLSAVVSGELAGADLRRRLEPFGLGARVGVVVLAPPRPGAGGLAA
ncbi:PucR family transcriptional regulator ligand-binding domain-containing protein, partial [Pseudonocardia sp. DLS-67]